MAAADLERLRAHGLDDRAIVDANQVVSYFNSVNRVADGSVSSSSRPWPQELREGRTYGVRRRELPSVAEESPWLSVAQMREVDRLMIEEFGIRARADGAQRLRPSGRERAAGRARPPRPNEALAYVTFRNLRKSRWGTIAVTARSAENPSC